MRPSRSTCYIVLIICLALSGTESVSAQAASTSISNLSYASRVLIDKGAQVTFTVGYTKGYNGQTLGIAIVDLDTYSSATEYYDYVKGTVYASPTDCTSEAGTEYSDSAICLISPLQESGSIDVTFNLKFYSSKTYSLEARALLMDSSPEPITSTWSTQDFSISVTDKFTLQVYAPMTIPVTIDGVPQGLGSAYLMVYPGPHTLSVPQIVNVTGSERLRFDHWSDGSTSTTKAVNVQDDTDFTVTYVTQYRLTLASPQGVATGEDWYDEGTKAEFSVPSSVPMSGILGALGGKYDFQGWVEGKTIISSSSNSSLRMASEHTLTATWTPNYTMPITVLAVVVIVVLVLTFYLMHKRASKPKRKRTRRKKPDQDTEQTSVPTITETVVETKTTEPAEATIEPKKATMFCNQCGAVVSRDSKFCEECGKKLVRE